MKNQYRILELKNIAVPIRVSHGNLSLEQRIDDIENRIDILNISISVSYMSNIKPQDKKMDGVWNYGDIYNNLCLIDVPTITGPLEGILDKTIKLIEESAQEQKIELNKVIVSANRLGLAVGYPKLMVKKIYSHIDEFEKKQCDDCEMERSAGICDFPLIISVNHGWCTGNQKVEHANERKESVKLSFHAETKSKPLSENDLSGLYNYAGLIHQVQKLQGIEINGPVEQLCDFIAEILEKDAHDLGVELLKITVIVERTGYARCTPVITLVKQF